MKQLMMTIIFVMAATNGMAQTDSTTVKNDSITWSQELEGVEIKAQRQLIKQEIDRIGYDVQDGIHALSILTGPRVGDDLYALDGRGGHGFQDLLGILRQVGVVASVLVDLETAVAFYLDIILTIYRHHRHLAEHVEYCERL